MLMIFFKFFVTLVFVDQYHTKHSNDRTKLENMV